METTTQAGSQPMAFSVAGLASETSLSKQTIYKEIEEGRLQARRIRGRIVIPRDAVEEWLRAAS